jgi:hypothetical protein
MLRKIALCVVVVSFFAAFQAQALPIEFFAHLSGAAENPPNDSTGFGHTTAIYDPDTQLLRVIATFGNLVAPVTVAHIHCCVDPPGNVGVATPVPTFPGFPAGVMAGDYDQTFDLTNPASFNPAFVTNFGGGTVGGAEAALVEGMIAERAYLNIHSSTYPAGEIRGFYTVIPEPGTYALLGSGLLGILAFRLRRRRS